MKSWNSVGFPGNISSIEVKKMVVREAKDFLTIFQ